jgi:large subunit ribosomal protein L25
VDFIKVWKKAGNSSVINLHEGAEEPLEALITDIDQDPVTDKVRHVDFYVIEKGKALKVKVPIGFEGVAPAVKELGGTLVKVLHVLEIEALPKDLPQSVVVDIGKLVALDSRVVASDIALPGGVKLITAPDEVVASVAAAREEEKEEPATPIDLTQIEVEAKGKKPEEGAEGAEAGAEAPKKEEAKK